MILGLASTRSCIALLARILSPRTSRCTCGEGRQEKRMSDVQQHSVRV